MKALAVRLLLPVLTCYAPLSAFAVLCSSAVIAAGWRMPPSHIWPPRTWALSALTAEQHARWERDGFLVVPNAVPLGLARDAAATIRTFVGADETNISSWYDNTLDIYSDRLPDGVTKPHHGPCGMAFLQHHASLWALRQHPRLHAIFSELYGTPRLYVTADRVHFKPPRSAEFPAWSDPGDVHKGLHWDVDTRRTAWPVPYVMQGVLYLEETTAAQGALRVVPGFHRRFEAWDATQPANRSAERLSPGPDADALMAESVPVSGPAGSLVVWHSLLPHGPGPNTASSPRVSAYLSMLPVDAAPFLGPTRRPDAPLSMSDAGTLSYLEWDAADTLAEPSDSEPAAAGSAGSTAEPADGGGRTATDGTAQDSACLHAEGGSGGGSGGAGGGAGLPGWAAHSALRRQSAERRAQRWRERLPLLDEDPREDELAHRPPSEEGGEPAVLTALGERLVGLTPWSTSDVLLPRGEALPS